MDQLSQLMLALLAAPASGAQPAAGEAWAPQLQLGQQQLGQQAARRQQPALPAPLAAAAARVLLALLRQSAERISRVRESAARALLALLPAAAAAGVAGAPALAAALCPLPLEAFGTGEALPPVAGLLVHPPLQRCLLEGLAFSIGGLDNQLATAAGDALAAAVERVEGEAGEPGLAQLAEAFIGLWEDAQAQGQAAADSPAAAGAAPAVATAAAARRARLATPLLAAADVLLSRTALRDVLAAQVERTAAAAAGAQQAAGAEAAGAEAGGAAAAAGAALPPGPAGRLLACVRGEVRGCTDIARLHLAAGVLCQLADLPQPLKGAALGSALGLLGNRYPKVGEKSSS